MSQYNRPDEVIFASGAKPGEVENFPDIQRGWGVAFDQTAGIPPMEWFNALFKRNDEALRYLLQRGIPEWSMTEDYPEGAYTQEGSTLWRAKVANLGKRPSSNPMTWVEATLSLDAVNTLIQEKLDSIGIKGHVRVATTANLALSGLQVVDGVRLSEGDRVLVKDQAAVQDNGIYVAGTGAWLRSTDANSSTKVTPNFLVMVEQGVSQADSLWQLVTDGPIILDGTALSFSPFPNNVLRTRAKIFGDLNNYITDQRGSGRNLVNTPIVDTGFWYVDVQSHYTDGAYCRQEASRMVGSSVETWVRHFYNGVWWPWVKIVSDVVQASEAERGSAKVATQDQVNAGVEDTAFVTPKKLRLGFSINLSDNGYIAFPTWLGGLVLQWGTFTAPSVIPGSRGGAVTFRLPVPYSRRHFGIMHQLIYPGLMNGGMTCYSRPEGLDSFTLVWDATYGNEVSGYLSSFVISLGV